MTPNQTDPYLDSIRLTFWTCLQLERYFPIQPHDVALSFLTDHLQ